MQDEAEGTPLELLFTVGLETRDYLRSVVLPTLRSRVLGGSRRYVRDGILAVTSPLAGAIPAQLHSSMERVPESVQRGSNLVNFGVLNPGRNGFSNPANDQVMWWRLWEIGLTAAELNLHVLIVPSPRLPFGVRLPYDFPFCFFGRRTTAWDSVGIFIQTEVCFNFELLECAENDRILWLLIHGEGNAAKGLLICVYAPPGGDVSFWMDLLREREVVKKASGAAYTIIAGDLNLHLQHLVKHDASCTCSHCKPSAADTSIWHLLCIAGFHCLNPCGVATHSSGTIIDLILCDSLDLQLPIATVKPPGSVALSDHSLVLNSVPGKIHHDTIVGFGRVAWTSGDEWDAALARIDSELFTLASIIQDITHTVGSGDFVSRKGPRFRRRIIDLAVWVRDAWYTVIGHLCSATRVSKSGGVKRPRRAVPFLTVNASLFRSSIEAIELTSRRHMVNTYLELRKSDRLAAERFLASKIKPSSTYTLALTDTTTGLRLSTPDTIYALQEDMERRAQRTLARDTCITSAAKRYVSEVRQALTSAISAAVPTPAFTEEELDAVLHSFNKSARTLRCPYIAVKSPVGGGRRLTLALANMFLRFGVVSTTSALREINHIHKKGPKIVRSIECLRPISFASDLAAVTDGLLRLRTLPQLREFWGASQGGGVHEALANVMAVVLLAQLRCLCSLPLILIFIDLSHAFDEADKDDMRIALYQAGIGGHLWLLYDGSLSTDHSRVHTGDFISEEFSMLGGTAQGRRISTDMFNGVIRFLHDLISHFSAGVGVWSNQGTRFTLQRAQSTSPAVFLPYVTNTVSRLGNSILA